MKKFLSVILAALILACPLSGFATDAVETLEWYFCEDIETCDPWIYNFKGDITTGETEIKFTEDDYFDYYTFNAEKTGYYYVECNNYEIDWFGFPEGIADGKAIREAEGYFVSGSYVEKKAVYKLNAGETVFGVDYNHEADPEDNCKVEIEYLGNEITDLIFKEKTFDNLVLDCDLLDNDGSYILTDASVVFSGGKTVAFPDEWIEVQTDDYEWEKGENKAVAVFMDFRKDVVVTACEMKDLVVDVEFVNLSEFENVTTSFNDSYNIDLYGAELAFTLANGEKATVNTSEEDFIEINNRYYFVYAFYDIISPEEVDIAVYLGNDIFKTYECNVTQESYIEGSSYLFSDIGENIKDSLYFSRVAFSEFLRIYDAGDIGEGFEDAFYYFRLSFNRIVNCFELVKMFMNYYF